LPGAPHGRGQAHTGGDVVGAQGGLTDPDEVPRPGRRASRRRGERLLHGRRLGRELEEHDRGHAPARGESAVGRDPAAADQDVRPRILEDGLHQPPQAAVRDEAAGHLAFRHRRPRAPCR
jgi:hypothetical protein